MTRRRDLADQAVIGLLNGTLTALPVIAVSLLFFDQTPTLWVLFLASETISVAVWVLLRIRRAREQRRLQETFDRPAFGEDQ